MSGINSMPLYDVVSQLIYSTQASQVSHVWSSGEPLLYNGKLQTIDEQKLKQNNPRVAAARKTNCRHGLIPQSNQRLQDK